MPDTAAPDPLTVRPWQSEDVPDLLRLNNMAVPQVNRLESAALERLLRDALVARVAMAADRGVAGFVICLGEGLDYASDNYRWFSARYDHFAYIDRVVVAPAYRGRGIGGRLYGAVDAAITELRPRLTCEVNAEPPNPDSLRFHARQGFAEVGRQTTEGGAKQVILMAKDVQ